MNLTIRARLTLLYFIVLAASFVAFFWICDFGFRRSIEITVNDASRTNLERVRTVIQKALPGGIPKVGHELTELSDLWASGALFEVAGPDGQWIFRSPRFEKPQAPFPELASSETSFLTTNLDLLQYRIARHGHGPTALTLNGSALAFEREENPYRTGGAVVSMTAVRALLTTGGNTMLVELQ